MFSIRLSKAKENRTAIIDNLVHVSVTLIRLELPYILKFIIMTGNTVIFQGAKYLLLDIINNFVVKKWPSLHLERILSETFKVHML